MPKWWMNVVGKSGSEAKVQSIHTIRQNLRRHGTSSSKKSGVVDEMSAYWVAVLARTTANY